MKSLLVALTLIASVTLTRANITDVWFAADNVNMSCTYNWSASAPTSASVAGTQLTTAAGSIYGYVTTDGSDPTLGLTESISNSTLATWSDYHVTISMPTNFTFSNVSVTAPAGWTSSFSQPTSSGGIFSGTLNFNALSAAADITPGETLAYGFSLTFNGSVNFTETAMPSLVPEPSVVGMGAVGGLLLLIARARRNR